VESTQLAAGVKVAVLSVYITVPATGAPPAVTVNVAPVMVVDSIASENVTVMGDDSPTPVAPEAGETERTEGFVTSELICRVTEAVPPVRTIVACPR